MSLHISSFEASFATGQEFSGTQLDDFNVAALTNPKKVLVLGAGLGGVVHQLSTLGIGTATFTLVDTSERNLKLARAIYSYAGGSAEIITVACTAREFLSRRVDRYDCVVVDLFIRSGHGPDYFDPEFWGEVAGACADDATALVNVFGLPRHLSPWVPPTPQASVAEASSKDFQILAALQYVRNTTFVMVPRRAMMPVFRMARTTAGPTAGSHLSHLIKRVESSLWPPYAQQPLNSPVHRGDNPVACDWPFESIAAEYESRLSDFCVKHLGKDDAPREAIKRWIFNSSKREQQLVAGAMSQELMELSAAAYHSYSLHGHADKVRWFPRAVARAWQHLLQSNANWVWSMAVPHILVTGAAVVSPNRAHVHPQVSQDVERVVELTGGI